ncbi:MAG: sugar phosphate nucleotidyltransferase [Candidatus Diapherotrites archaeon]|nr:sugar phosphate nucleotidyltransferase [Candidatus Diapherotrites archaeon]
MKIKKAVILAAGKGLRLRPLTENVPKTMVKLKGKPILEWILDSLNDTSFEEVIIVVGYKKENIINYFGNKYKNLKISYVVQEEQKGTAHAISLVEGRVEKKFLVMNGDVIASSKLISEISEYEPWDEWDIVIVGREVDDPWRYGIISFENEKINDIVEKPMPGEEPSKIANTGIYRFDTKIFSAIKITPLSRRNEYEITDSIKIMINLGAKVKLLISQEKIIDIGTKQDLEEAEKLL